jgi:hypothetical protein
MAKPRNLLLLGPSGSGKTTFLNALKGRPLSSSFSPTIGVVTETTKHKSSEWQIIDVGGDGLCHRTMQYLKEYHNRDGASVFFHDCLNGNIQESVRILELHLAEMVDCKARFIWIVLNNTESLETANTSTDVGTVVKELGSVLQQQDGRILWRLWDQQYFTARDKGPEQLLEELGTFVQRSSGFEPRKEVTSTTESTICQNSLTCESAREDVPIEQADAFWSLFGTHCGLLSTTHVERLGAIYLVLLEGINSRRGILETTERLLLNGRQIQNLGPSGNRTMVTFWLFQMNTAIQKYQAREKTSELTRDDFDKVAACGRHLLTPDAWTRYYSDSLMTSSHTYYRLPDLRDLSCLFAPSLTAPHCTSSWDCMGHQHPERLPRYAYEVVKTYLTASGPQIRNQIVELALSTLQSSTMRQRYRNPLIETYSETQTYFWIQHIHQFITQWANKRVNRAGAQPTAAEYAEVIKGMDYIHMKQFVPIDPQAWKTHYTEKLWTHIGSRLSFQAPDKKPLGESIGIWTPRLFTDESRVQLWQNGYVPDLPSDEELSFKLALALQTLESVQAQKREREQGKNSISHTHLLFLIYSRFLNSHMQRNTWDIEGITTELLPNVGHDKSTEELRFWVTKIHGIVSKGKWVPPRRAVGAATAAFEQFRIFMNTHIDLIHEPLFAVEMMRQRIRAELVSAQDETDDDGTIEGNDKDEKSEDEDGQVVNEKSVDEETLYADDVSDWEVVQ